LSDYKKNDSVADTIKNATEVIQPTILTDDLIKTTLEKNKIILPFKSPKLNIW